MGPENGWSYVRMGETLANWLHIGLSPNGTPLLFSLPGLVKVK
jgi:hypothetical protein